MNQSGKEVSAEELAGKSGKVKITIEYTNKDAHIVNVNGVNTTLYTPFVAVCGAIIDNSINRNIEITNGKVIDDGSKTVVIGLAMPGMQESLNVSSSKFEIPNNIEITMDTESFELGNLITFVTPKIIEDDDLKVFDELDTLYGSIGTLGTSANLLEEGSKELKSGSSELVSGSSELKNGIYSAYSGANQIKSEVSKATKALQADKSEALDSSTLNAIKAEAIKSATLTDAQKAAISKEARKNATLTEEQKQAIVVRAKAISTLSPEQKQIITAKAKQSATLSEVQKQAITAKATSGSTLTDAQKQSIIANANQTAGNLSDAQKALLDRKSVVQGKSVV